jgi:oxygen-independent coproporphyrinogen III oxidase
MPTKHREFGVPPAKLIEKYSKKKGSFYAYYPMNGLWTEDVGDKNYSEAIDSIFQDDPKKSIALYIHFPFCETQCLFCHCFTIISKNKKDHDKIINYIIREIELLKKICDAKGYNPNIKEIHFGGGSPSNLSDENFSRLFSAIRSLSASDKFDECALEIDPRYNVDKRKLHFYAEQGINRISFGIQDFDKEIGKIVNRINSPEAIQKLITPEIRKIFDSVNFDLIYGMPQQTLNSWLLTIDKAVELDPDRLAVYVWGFRPDLYPHMKALKKYDLAGPQLQMEMFVGAVNKFIKNGYDFIGIDHMAKANDVLFQAKKNGTLDRNAIGYTPGRSKDVIAVGPNSMSTVGNYYFQNFHFMEKYYSTIDSGHLPLVRGFKAQKDDLLRRDIIFSIILHSSVDLINIVKDYQLNNFWDYFDLELKDLKEMEDDGLILINKDKIEVTQIGRFFQRHICKVFDKYDRNIGYRYSREFEDGKAAFDRNAQLKANQ